MAGRFLTTQSTILCPHGGNLVLVTTQAKADAGRSQILLETDVHQVAGCTFNVSGAPSPCLTVRWSAGATRVTANGTATLLESSVGTCYNGTNAPQGVAVVANTQPKCSGK